MTLFIPPRSILSSSHCAVGVENGRFVLTGEPTSEDVAIFERWRDEIEAAERELEDPV